MMKNKLKILIFVVVLTCMFTMPAASQTKVSIATVWDAPMNMDGVTLNYNNASRNVQLSRKGFVRGLSAAKGNLDIEEFTIPENTDLRTFLTSIADINNMNEVLFSVGGSTDEASMYASMAMNYFNTPFLIPFADGDLSSGGGSAFSVRMTPTSSNYANFIGNNLFPLNLVHYIESYVFENMPVPDYHINLAIFFADNFNGHETAVDITQKMLDNRMDVDVYVPFGTNELLQEVTRKWDEFPNMMNIADVVMIVAEDDDPLPDLESVIKSWTSRSLDPIFLVIGYNPTELSEYMLTKENLYVIQQALDMSNCPSDILNRREAEGYAAGLITGKVLNNAVASKPDEPSGIRLWFRSEEERRRLKQENLNSFRYSIRASLLSLNENIPCYGYVDFNIPEEDRASLELVRYVGLDQTVKVDESVIFYNIVNRIRRAYGLEGGY